MSSIAPSNLRDRQIEILEHMLHLNKEGSADLTLASKSEEIIWKVLVLDNKSRGVISSVLRVNDLLRCGITVHSLINSNRSPLPDVPVIYFVEPTIENILQIIDDLNQDKYDSFYINFTTSINRELLEEFAKKVSVSGKSFKIKQVYDQYLDFIVTEPNLFSLNLPRIFTRFNTAGTDEDTIHQLVDRIAQGLLSTIIAMDTVPVIRAQQHGPAEFVASQLDLKLRDYLSNSRNTGAGSSQSIHQRPVLILLDRNFDLTSMFSHSWIYQCMVSDVFTLQRNTIKIRKYTKESTDPSIKSYDVDPRDFFWNKYSQLPFPDVVENADAELNAYKNDAKEVTSKTGLSSLHDIDPNANDTANIQQAVEKLPELTARKATLDMHMDILAALISELQAKTLDKFFEIEQNANDPKELKEFLDLLPIDSERDSSSDKLRTLIILTLVADVGSEYVSKAKQIFRDKYPHIDLSALDYILKFKENSKLANLTSLSNSASQKNSYNNQQANLNSSALLSGLSSKLYGLTEGRISEGLSSIATRIKSFIPEKKQLPITNIIEAIMEPNNASANYVQLTDEYLYLDPKSRGGHSKPPRRQSYQEAFVFVVGGGNYLEYQNLQEWASEPGKSPRKVVYGSTDIISPTGFIEECNELGKN
ncbi:SLY1 [[Candida] subhashii]|uniref:SLY1 n=1 Tax=[Candida] subhashii TaxID=561895 RepID=A0A8J5QJV8_9ASCO|nr:SLY1 [[Candida] subhashii]KAG7661778.1 SLY1 [[Candida] subhashii]